VDHGIFDPRQAAVIEPALDDEYLAMPLTIEKEHRVAYTGSWIARKGIGKLTRVMNEILIADPGLRFDIYGTAGNREAVLDSFPALLHDRIEVHGRLSNEQLANDLSRAKVFLFPSQYEGFGMALGEAMACSCAVVTTPTGFGAELRDGVDAFVCGFDDIDRMKSSVLRLLSNEEERLSIARAGWERVRTLKWDSNIRKLEATYERWCDEWQARRDRVVVAYR
jgi:glycosyltransferase involved in cell wall biosynthesis